MEKNRYTQGRYFITTCKDFTERWNVQGLSLHWCCSSLKCWSRSCCSCPCHVACSGLWLCLWLGTNMSQCQLFAIWTFAKENSCPKADWSATGTTVSRQGAQCLWRFLSATLPWQKATGLPTTAFLFSECWPSGLQDIVSPAPLHLHSQGHHHSPLSCTPASNLVP